MSEPLTTCCGAPESIYFEGFCAKCGEHASLETLCTKCEDPCLLDGEPIDGLQVTYTQDEGGFELVSHVVCPQ